MQIGICPVEQIECGNQFSIVKDKKDKLWGFGSNMNGQLGTKSQKYELFPVIL